MNIVWGQLQAQDCPCIVFDNTAQIVRLPARSIIYLESFGHQVIVHMADQEKHLALTQKFSVVLKQLPKPLFVQCHRSYIVNLMYVRRFASSTIKLTNGLEITLGRKWKTEFIDAFRQYYLEG